jgi:hypothetical protein
MERGRGRGERGGGGDEIEAERKGDEETEMLWLYMYITTKHFCLLSLLYQLLHLVVLLSIMRTSSISEVISTT